MSKDLEQVLQDNAGHRRMVLRYSSYVSGCQMMEEYEPYYFKRNSQGILIGSDEVFTRRYLLALNRLWNNITIQEICDLILIKVEYGRTDDNLDSREVVSMGLYPLNTVWKKNWEVGYGASIPVVD